MSEERQIPTAVLLEKLDKLIHDARPVPLTDQVRIDREGAFDLIDQLRWRLSTAELLAEALERARKVVDEQAEDEALWAEAIDGTTSIYEAYVRQELRKLHAVVEAADGAVATYKGEQTSGPQERGSPTGTADSSARDKDPVSPSPADRAGSTYKGEQGE